MTIAFPHYIPHTIVLKCGGRDEWWFQQPIQLQLQLHRHFIPAFALGQRHGQWLILMFVQQASRKQQASGKR